MKFNNFVDTINTNGEFFFCLRCISGVSCQNEARKQTAFFVFAQVWSARTSHRSEFMWTQSWRSRRFRYKKWIWLKSIRIFHFICISSFGIFIIFFMFIITKKFRRETCWWEKERVLPFVNQTLRTTNLQLNNQQWMKEKLNKAMHLCARMWIFWNFSWFIRNISLFLSHKAVKLQKRPNGWLFCSV